VINTWQFNASQSVLQQDCLSETKSCIYSSLLEQGRMNNHL
jgi:hypothetical protein